MRISSAGNATFAGEVTISSETQYLNFKKASTLDLLSTIVSETDAGTGGKLRFLTKRNGDTQLNALILDDNQNATFSANITVSGTSSSLATGSSGTFVTNDSNNYPRITINNGNAQLGLFRSGSSAGGM